MAVLAWGQVKSKTVVVEARDQHGETLVADLCIHEVWLSQAEELIDIHVVDTDAQLYLCHTPSRVLFNTEVQKKNKYADACSARCSHFKPLCFSVDGVVGTEATCFLRGWHMLIIIILLFCCIYLTLNWHAHKGATFQPCFLWSHVTKAKCM